MSKNKISAFLITKNEEKNIRRALESLTWADEIILVDDVNTHDKTTEIAREFTDKIFSRPWSGFSNQRNFALEQTQFDWIFFLDADEVCSDELILWFKNFQNQDGETLIHALETSPSQHPQGGHQSSRIDMIEIRRWEHFRGVRYCYGENNPSHQWRFFRRDGAKFIGDVHEYVTFRGEIRRLEKPILHFPRENLTEMMEKINRYSTLDADRLFHQGVKRPLHYMFFSGLAMFLKCYFRKQGFRDGVLGFIMAVNSGTVFFLKQAKLYLKHRGL